jgi:molecular chaperone GrpE (heat shock protein)
MQQVEFNPDSLSKLLEISEQIRHLQDLFDEKIKHDSHKNQQIDHLHEELQEHKRDLLASTLRPILSGLVRLSNNASRLLQDIDRSGDDVPAKRVAGIVSSFVEDVERLLADQGVLLFEDFAEGDQFNPRRQQAVGFEDSREQEHSGRIAERLRPGYEYGGILLQKERVRVFKVSDPVPAARISEEQSNGGQSCSSVAKPSPTAGTPSTPPVTVPSSESAIATGLDRTIRDAESDPSDQRSSDENSPGASASLSRSRAE